MKKHHILFLGVALVVAVQRSIKDATLVFVDAPRRIVPDGLAEQVKLFRSVVPPGSTILYITDEPEAWHLGLWQRSLYPDYKIVPIQGRSQLHAIQGKKRQGGFRVNYALSAGNPQIDPPFQWKQELPQYPNGITTILGRLPSE